MTGKEKGSWGDPLPVFGLLKKLARVIPLWMTLLESSDYSAASAITSTDTYFRASLPAWKRTRPPVSAKRV